jgi:aminomethyltransferase
MGFPLYGHEFTEEMTPLDGGMERFLDMDKDFIGKQALVKQREQGVFRRLIGFIVDGRRTPRHENRIVSGKSDAGFVTSGVFSPHLNRGIGMGYIDIDRYGGSSELLIDTDKGEIHAMIEQVPFLKQTSIKYSEA